MLHHSSYRRLRTLLLLAVLGLAALAASHGSKAPAIGAAVTGQDPGKTSEISTDELRAILVSGSATVFDVRPRAEYGMGHIPARRTRQPNRAFRCPNTCPTWPRSAVR